MVPAVIKVSAKTIQTIVNFVQIKLFVLSANKPIKYM